MTAPPEMFMAGYSEQAGWTKERGQLMEVTASMAPYNSCVKYKGNFYYFGTPEAEKIFDNEV
jgi:hypothetical protein